MKFVKSPYAIEVITFIPVLGTRPFVDITFRPIPFTVRQCSLKQSSILPLAQSPQALENLHRKTRNANERILNAWIHPSASSAIRLIRTRSLCGRFPIWACSSKFCSSHCIHGSSFGSHYIRHSLHLYKFAAFILRIPKAPYCSSQKPIIYRPINGSIYTHPVHTSCTIHSGMPLAILLPHRLPWPNLTSRRWWAIKSRTSRRWWAIKKQKNSIAAN